MSHFRTTVANLKADFKQDSLLGLLWSLIPLPGEHRAIVIYRLARLLAMWRLRFVARWMRQMNICLYGCDISPLADIAGGFLLPHTVGIVIGDGVTIGRDCAVYQNVTLGAKVPGDPKDYPVLGNNVRVYTGAVVLGAVRIDDGAVVGANSVVVRDVPAGTTVGGVPARVLVSRALGQTS